MMPNFRTWNTAVKHYIERSSAARIQPPPRTGRSPRTSPPAASTPPAPSPPCSCAAPMPSAPSPDDPPGHTARTARTGQTVNSGQAAHTGRRPAGPDPRRFPPIFRTAGDVAVPPLTSRHHVPVPRTPAANTSELPSLPHLSPPCRTLPLQTNPYHPLALPPPLRSRPLITSPWRTAPRRKRPVQQRWSNAGQIRSKFRRREPGARPSPDPHGPARAAPPAPHPPGPRLPGQRRLSMLQFPAPSLRCDGAAAGRTGSLPPRLHVCGRHCRRPAARMASCGGSVKARDAVGCS